MLLTKRSKLVFYYALLWRQVATAFHVAVPGRTSTTRIPSVDKASVADDELYPKVDYERAIVCSEKLGLCTESELIELAEELEEFQGCYFQDNAPDCEKELDGRFEVADMLRAQAEMLRTQADLKRRLKSLAENKFVKDLEQDLGKDLTHEPHDYDLY